MNQLERRRLVGGVAIALVVAAWVAFCSGPLLGFMATTAGCTIGCLVLLGAIATFGVLRSRRSTKVETLPAQQASESRTTADIS